MWRGSGAATAPCTGTASQLSSPRHVIGRLVENAHLFAVLHIAMADASIAAWDAKYRYVFWRPVTAIPSLDDERTVGFVFGTRVAAIAVNVTRAERHTDCLASLS